LKLRSLDRDIEGHRKKQERIAFEIALKDDARTRDERAGFDFLDRLVASLESQRNRVSAKMAQAREALA
jgi:hypothetical protein